MHFLIDADLPRLTGGLVEGFGHHATDVRDIGLGESDDAGIAAHAAANGLCILSAADGFADIRNYPPDRYSGIVVFDLPKKINREIILGLVEDFFVHQQDVIKQLPGRLAIVKRGRVRLRPK